MLSALKCELSLEPNNTGLPRPVMMTTARLPLVGRFTSSHDDQMLLAAASALAFSFASAAIALALASASSVLSPPVP